MNVTRNWLILACVIVALGATSNLRADFTFGESTAVGSALSGDVGYICFSYDGLEMYIGSPRGGGQGMSDIWVLKRVSRDEPWGPPQNLGPAVNTSSNDGVQSISADGLTLYFCSDRPYSDDTRYNIYMTTRATKNDAWGPAVKMGPEINGPGNVSAEPWISQDGLELYFDSWRSGGYGGVDIHVARRSTVNDPWTNAVNLGPLVNTASWDWICALSPDGLLLLFSDWQGPRPGGYGGGDMWMARRATLSDPWQAPVNLGPRVNRPGDDWAPRISLDGRTLYFLRNWQLWQASIIPIVDFNGDGTVAMQDLLRLIKSWGQNDPAVDMGPMPWGDSKVDEKDLEVLMSYWGQEVNDPTLVAHWALDEADGITAHDRAGGNDGTLIGLPQWRPQGGTIGGALELNGKTFATAKSALSPAAGPFSILAWIKGGAPGQVIVSQQGGVNWLMADAATGALGTELSKGGGGLSSPAIITDGTWHRIAFTWDGAHRRLYVDGALAAEDAQDTLGGAAGNLVLGAGKTMAPGTFWKGLIDDVRIYNRAVKP